MSKQVLPIFSQLCDAMSNIMQDKKYSKQHYPAHNYFSSVAKFVPENPKAAALELAGIDDDYCRLFSGRSTTIEFRLRKGEIHEFLESIKGISQAVIDGKFIETVWLSGDKVTRYYSEFELKDRVIKSRDCNIFAYLFLNSRKHVYHYEKW